MRTLAADPRYLGTARPGFFGVLHTWGRTPEYRPDVHYVVPGGGLSADGDRWLASRTDFLVPVKALSIVFRGKFRDLLTHGGLLEAVNPSVWRGDWVVHCQPAGDGRGVSALPGTVCVPGGDRRPSDRVVRRRPGDVHVPEGGMEERRRKMTLDAQEFLRRLLAARAAVGLRRRCGITAS